jgi:hypothetical protein
VHGRIDGFDARFRRWCEALEAEDFDHGTVSRLLDLSAALTCCSNQLRRGTHGRSSRAMICGAAPHVRRAGRCACFALRGWQDEYRKSGLPDLRFSCAVRGKP